MSKNYLLIFLLLSIVFSGETRAELSSGQLRGAAQEKAKDLQQIHAQMQETQKNLNDTAERSRTLQQELKNINSNVRQLNLNIKLSEVTIEKLELEIESLRIDIDKTQKQVGVKSDAVNQILRELQLKDAEEIIIVFLKNNTLADALNEGKALSDIKDKLSQDLAELRQLQLELGDKLNEASDKKSRKEKEKEILGAKKSITEDQKKERQRLLSDTKNQEKLYNQLIDALAQRQTQIAEEIEAIEADLRLKIDPNALPARRPGLFGWPIALPRITQGYGATSFARSRSGYRGRWHNGIDLGAPIGTLVLAPAEGTVISIGNQDLYCRRGAYGKYVAIRHPNNLVTLYGHLSNITAVVGALVKQGEVIGFVGNTGYSRGAHLHFTVYDGNTFSMRSSNSCGLMPSGGDINPLEYLGNL
jgi:murein DD-endopeptidase MepM/ murein hydrolase activator NlpD